MIERFMTAEPGAGWVFILGSLIIIIACMVAGAQLHRTLFYALPEYADSMGGDAGAWIGVILGLAIVLLV